MMQIASGKPPPQAKDQLSHGESTDDMMRIASGRYYDRTANGDSTESMLKAALGNSPLKLADDSTPMDISLSESEDGKVRAVTNNLAAFCNLAKIRRGEIILSTSSEQSPYSDSHSEGDGDAHPAQEMNGDFGLGLEEHDADLNDFGVSLFLFNLTCLSPVHV